MKVKLTLTQEMLGTKAANKEVFKDWIASKHPSGTPQRDELDNAEHAEESGTTIFHRDNGVVGIYNYQIKGFFKEACGALNRCDKEYRNGLDPLKAYKTKIDKVIYVNPRFIPLELPEGWEGAPALIQSPSGVHLLGVCERPLRCDTAQGPRVALARSEEVPVGTTLTFEVSVMAKELRPYVELWLGFGKLSGLGQWRNSGRGTFTYEIL